MINDAQYIIDPERIGTLGGIDLSNPYARITPAMGASAQDFSFGKSIFDVMDGNPDGESVSGVAGISLIDEDSAKGRNRDKDKDEGGLSWDDVRVTRERLRAEIESISLSDGQFSIFGMKIAEADMDAAVKDTLNNFDAFAAKHNLQGAEKDQFQQWLIYYNSLPEGDPRKADALRKMATINPGAAHDIAWQANNREARASSKPDVSAADNAELQAQGDAEGVIARATTGNAVSDNAIAANIDDQAVWLEAREEQGFNDEEAAALAERRSGDTLDFAFGDTRSGPVITSVYNASAAGAQTLAQAEALAEPGQRSNAEFAIG